jgi:septum formation protein
LSGKTHQIFTGLAVIDTKTGQKLETVVVTNVTFRQLSPEMIEAYVATGEPLGKAGAYGIQGKAIIFLDKLEGDNTNVIGLPVPKLAEFLQQLVWLGKIPSIHCF